MENQPVCVLLIEDDPGHAESVRRAFGGRHSDMWLVVAGSLAEARQRLETFAPYVVVCDYHLPDGTGLDFLRRYWSIPQAMPPFVLLTSRGDETMAVEAMRAGAIDYIVKDERSLASLPEVCRALIGGYRQQLDRERLEQERTRLISELKANEALLSRSKRRLEKSEQLLNRAQEMAHLGCFELDLAANRLYWSDEVYRILGLEPQSCPASYQTFLETVHPDDRSRVARLLAATVGNRLDGYELEYRIVKRVTGEIRYLHGKWDQSADVDGKVERIVGIILDITERKMAQERILQSEQKFSRAFNNAPVMICLTRLEDGAIRDVNKKFSELTGFSREEAVGHRTVDLRLIAPDHRQRLLEELEREGRISGMEVVLYSKEGRKLTVLHHGEVILVEGTRCLLSISIDITGHRHLEEQLRQSQKMEAIGQLAGGVAHDFNNILTVIMGYGNLLSMNARLDDEGREAVSQILCSSERAAQLTHGLLAFSRKQITTTKNCNLNDIVQRVRDFLLRTIGENIEFSSLCCEESLNVCVDAGQIEQVLINLATNARDAMPTGGVLSVRTELQKIDRFFVKSHGLGSVGTYAVLTVSDNGSGMDAVTRSRIFEPFFTTKKMGKGTGLGMAIVYGIVQQHKGFIYVYSEPGVGTTFRIYLPFSGRECDQGHEAAEADHPRGGTETILVAEDEGSVRKLVETVLTRAGYRVLLASDGQECVEKFAEYGETVDLVLMDMIMPKKDGIQAYQEISALRPGARVLFSSGYASDFLVKRVVDAREEVLMKPVKPLELLRVVRETLDRHSPEQTASPSLTG